MNHNDIAKSYPLSPLQKGMLLHWLRDPNVGLDVEQLVISLNEKVEKDNLVNAWKIVMARHAVLRSSIVWEGIEEPIQKVHNSVDLPFEERDWCEAKTEELATRLDTFLTEDRIQGFTLSKVPLMRLSLIHQSEDSACLVWTFHHAILDGRSFTEVLDEVWRLYDSNTAYNSELPSRVPFRDHVKFIASKEFSKADAFWRPCLKGISSPTPLVVDITRGESTISQYRQADCRRFLDSDMTRSIQEFVERESITLNTLVQGSWAQLLGRYSGEENVLFGATRACRHSSIEGADSIIGLLINTLPVRANLSPDQKTGDWLRDLRNNWVEMRPYENTPLSKIQSWSEIPAGNPLFNSLVVYENYLIDDYFASRGGNWKNRRLRLYEQNGFPITVTVYGGKNLCLQIEYDKTLFDPQTIERMLEHLKTLMTSMAQNPDRPLKDIKILPSSESDLLLQWNQTERKYPTDSLLHQAFESKARNSPDSIALVFEEEELTYQQLNERSELVAKQLVDRGAKPEVLVGVFMERSIEMVVALYGILKSGAAYVPIDPEYPEDRTEFMIEDANVSVLLTQTKLISSIPSTKAKIISLDDPDFLSTDSPPIPVTQTARESNLAYMIYTSGSTGKPKGALNEHRGICNRLHWMQERYQLTENDVVLQKTPFSFDVSVWEFFWPLMTGAKLVIAKPGGHQDPTYLSGLIQEAGVTVLHFVPSMLSAFLDDPGAVNCKSLRHVICSGEALPFELQEKFFSKMQAELHNLYGPTEAAVDVTHWTCLRDSSKRSVPIGKPVANTSIHILDKFLCPTPIGVPGELHIGGVQVGRGYHRRSELTADRFITVPDESERLYKTGDLCRFLDDGNIEYLGRLDHQVKIHGLRIELGEIEAALNKLPQVKESVALVNEDHPGSKRLIGYVVLEECNWDQEEVKCALSTGLPDYMIPSLYVVMEHFPLSANGKIDRKRFPSPKFDTDDRESQFAAPESPVEQTLAKIWSSVLKVERVGIDDNFFELGGDSILSIQIVSRARAAGFALSPKQLLKRATIRELAPEVTPIESPSTADQEAIFGIAPLSPIQEWFFDGPPEESNYYNQAFLFEVKSNLSFETLKRAFTIIEAHHDALRLRFSEKGDLIEQWFSEPTESSNIESIDFSSIRDDSFASNIESECIRIQASLNLAKGPLYRALFIETGAKRSNRLLIAVHHLAIDGVSWRVLIEDLEKAYQANPEEPTPLPSKTTSFKEWSIAMEQATKDGLFNDDLEHWRSVVSDFSCMLPTDKSDGDNTEGSCNVVTVQLSETETRTLLKEAPARYNTQINDLMVAALLKAVGDWSGQKKLLIDLEGHGREDIFEGFDLSRTIGWFTSIYPVSLQMTEDDVGIRIRSVKERLRAVPRKGISYGALRYLTKDRELGSGEKADLIFNYLGQFDQVVENSKLFNFATESSGPWHSPRGTRRYLLEVNAMVKDGSMSASWTFSENRHHPETIQNLAKQWIKALREIVSHCTATSERTLTPSDFPLSQLKQSELDSLSTRFSDIEDIYPLSPIQRLFHTVGASDSRKVLDQWQCVFSGPLQPDLLRQAWETLIGRHPVLRTSFQSAELAEPLQVVHSGGPADWTIEDWRGYSLDEQDAKFQSWLAVDRDKGVPLDRPLLSRFGLFQQKDEQFRFVWTVPALTLDGWSWPVLFSELSRLYGSLESESKPQLPHSRSYRDFIEWRLDRLEAEAQSFWQGALAGMTEPTPLVGGSIDPTDSANGGDNRSEWSALILEKEANEFIAFARRCKISPNTLIQAAWAAVMSRQSKERDVIFGSAFAGRPNDLDGASNIIGPFVNNLPVRVDVDPETTVDDFLHRVHENLLQINEFQLVSMDQVQSWSQIPWRYRLFESIVVVQNYTIDDSAQRLGESIEIIDFEGPIHSNFPLLLLVEPNEEWRIKLIFDNSELPFEEMGRWGSNFVQVLEAFASTPDMKLEGILESMSIPRSRTSSKPLWQTQSQEYIAPGTDIERQISRVWEDMLGIEKISIEQNVFDMGVHSLLIVKLHQQMQLELKREFPLIQMFQFPTIQSLANYFSGSNEQSHRETAHKRAAKQRGAMALFKRVGRKG